MRPGPVLDKVLWVSGLEQSQQCWLRAMPSQPASGLTLTGMLSYQVHSTHLLQKQLPPNPPPKCSDNITFVPKKICDLGLKKNVQRLFLLLQPRTPPQSQVLGRRLKITKG